MARRPSKRTPRKRTAMRRRGPARRTRSRRKSATPAKKHGAFVLFFFWPFLVVHRLTRSWPALLRIPARLGGDLAVLACFFLVLGALFYFVRSLRYDLDRVDDMPERSRILDCNKKEIGRLHGANRYIVDLEEVSMNFRRALLAREDRNFENHVGVDPRGVARAVVENFKRGRMAQGASTLTMQLARNAFHLNNPGPPWKELDRKFLELAIALRIEARYSKDEILQHYMNLIFWGGSVNGVEAASRTYFEKSAKDLTLSEGATLAGIIRAPNAFSPFNDLEKTRRERDSTLDTMLRFELATEEEVAAAKKAPLHIRPPHRRIIHDNYAMDAVRRDLEIILEKENIKLGGLTIVTTIDQNLQEAAERSLDSRLRSVERRPGYRHQTRSIWQGKPAGQRGAPAYLQGAVVVIENQSGAVRAVVGGRDADESKFNRAQLAKRPVGSIFKPFVYLAAFDRGLRPATMLEDGPLRPGEIKFAPRDWSPENSDGKYRRLVSAHDALIHSRNTSSVRVGNLAGMENVADVAKMAFNRKIPNQASSYLGPWDATPWEVASAYSLFPNGGIRYRPYLISEIRDGDKVLYSTEPLPFRAARTGAAWTTSTLLEETARSGTGAAIRSTYQFNAPVGGKTGTTNDYHDAWFAGYSSSVSCAVWVGLDQPDRIMNSGYGSVLAMPIWVDVMKVASRLKTPELKGRYPFLALRPPVESTTCRLCRYSARRATTGCEQARTAYDDQVPNDLLPHPNAYCTNHPLRAQPVSQLAPRARPVEATRRPARAQPVAPPAPRAIPVE